jgi:RNA polymerase sigma factor (sigma-70 family)
MTTNHLNRIVLNLGQVARVQAATNLPDGELLECYITRRDETAFATLVRRHGPMVLGVCRRILRNEADAEDAFQATFLVLVSKAASVRPRGMVSNWLYGVAHNTALKAKAMNRKRHTKELAAGKTPKAQIADEIWQQLQGLVDGELSHLPDNYRVPIVLCDLEGKTVKQAALHLGWPQGTVATRLRRGRQLLARRLSKSGLAISGALVAAVCSEAAASVRLSPSCVVSTNQAAKLFAAGKAAAPGAISAKVTALTEGVLRAMLLTKLKLLTAVFAVLVMFVSGAGLLVQQAAPAAAAGQAQTNYKEDAKTAAKSDRQATTQIEEKVPARQQQQTAKELQQKVALAEKQVDIKRAAVKIAEAQKRLAEAKLQIAKATVQTAIASVRHSEEQLLRMTKLAQDGTVSQAIVHQTEGHLMAAKASLREAEGSMLLAERQIDVEDARREMAEAELAEFELRLKQLRDSLSAAPK